VYGDAGGHVALWGQRGPQLPRGELWCTGAASKGYKRALMRILCHLHTVRRVLPPGRTDFLTDSCHIDWLYGP
jgi:hypothetical protein